MRWALCLLIVLCLVGCRGENRGVEDVRVFAAASLTDVMEAVADSFAAAEAGRTAVRLNLASSSLLARQIARGADADVFISAHPVWTNYLREEGRTGREVQLPIGNHLVVVAPDSIDSFDDGGRIAIADPEHVPAGIYAKEALQCEGTWQAVQRRIVPTIDVRAALAAVSAGSATRAVVYASDARLVRELFTAPAVSEACEPEIRYTAVVVVPGRAAAHRFVRLLESPRMEPVWRRYGFRYTSKEPR